MTDFDERNARLDGPIHGWFGLTYSNYLVLCRSMNPSMPVGWQQRAVKLFDELDHAFPDLKRPPNYIVEAARECEYGELTAADMTALGVALALAHDTEDDVAVSLYVDFDGTEHEPGDRVLVPIGKDPVPHYDRGRTFIEPTSGAS